MKEDMSMTDQEIIARLKTYPLATVQNICLSGNEFWSNAAQNELARRKKLKQKKNEQSRPKSIRNS
ncbi:MAG: hypothetical protein KGZ85_07925 [Ignavibacterium sp.]|nr:hypothetical protein [Ignavibacterium sp.]